MKPIATTNPAAGPTRLATLLQSAAAARLAGRPAEAAARLRDALALAPRDPTIHLDLGVVLFTLRAFDLSLPHLDQALALDDTLGAAHYWRGRILEVAQPTDAAASYQCAIEAGFATAAVHSRLAALYDQAGQREDAATFYRAAAGLAPGTFAALKDSARAALIDGNLAEAEPLLQQALAARPNTASLRADLAHILRARGDFDAAAQELERGLRAAPDEIGLYYDLVQTRRIGPEDGDLVAQMRAGLTVPSHPAKRVKLHLALAKACDDLGDYAGAGDALAAAEVLRAAENRFDSGALVAQTDRILQLFTPDYMAHARHSGRAQALPVLVVGMPRTGTTLVEQILASHPAGAGAGELRFWEWQGRAFLEAADPRLGADLRAVADAYIDKLRDVAPAAARVVDKMPFNFRWAPLVHLALPQARIIHCRRHPADTCLSILSTNMTASATFPMVREDLVQFYIQYQRLVRQWRTMLPDMCWMDVDYDDLVTMPEPTIRRIVDFCGLAWDPACLAPERSRSTVLTFSQYQARQPINRASVGRWRRYGDWLEPFAALADRGA